MNLSDVIKTKRLKIIPFSKEYLTPRYISWLNDPEVVRYSNQRFQTHTLESCIEFLKSFENSNNFFWAIINQDKNLGHIGNVTAYVDIFNKVADIGILIGEKSAWKQGYGIETWLAICDYLFNKVKLRKVTAGTAAKNKAMLGIMRCAGMKEDGRRIKQCLIDNKPIDHVYAALFREEFIK